MRGPSACDARCTSRRSITPCSGVGSGTSHAGASSTLCSICQSPGRLNKTRYPTGLGRSVRYGNRARPLRASSQVSTYIPLSRSSRGQSTSRAPKSASLTSLGSGADRITKELRLRTNSNHRASNDLWTNVSSTCRLVVLRKDLTLRSRC